MQTLPLKWVLKWAKKVNGQNYLFPLAYICSMAKRLPHDTFGGKIV